MPSGLLHMRDNLARRRANNDQLGLGNPLGQIDSGIGDRGDPPGDPQAHLAAADADDAFGQISLRSASPIDPPIKPTPTIATFPNRFILQSGRSPAKVKHVL